MCLFYRILNCPSPPWAQLGFVAGDHPTTSIAIAARAGIISNVNSIHRFADLPAEQDVSRRNSTEKADVDVTAGHQGIVLTGPELDQLDAAQVERLCQYEEIVFARTTPEQKLRIVNEFKRRGCIVAMTGDGVNDAPSLKAADCKCSYVFMCTP